MTDLTWNDTSWQWEDEFAQVKAGDTDRQYSPMEARLTYQSIMSVRPLASRPMTAAEVKERKDWWYLAERNK